MHLYLQFNGRFTPKADRVARLLAERHGYTIFTGLSTSEGHVTWLRKEKNTPVRYGHIQALPELWRRAFARGIADPARLARLEADYGNLWPYILADRNLGHTFLTGTIVPDTAMRRRAADQRFIFACIQELFDYFETQFTADRPDAVFFQVVAGSPALVCAAVCGRLGIPFFNIGKKNFGDRHPITRNALMQPDGAVERYADPALTAGPDAEAWLDAFRNQPVPPDSLASDRKVFASRHGGSLPGVVLRHLAALPKALRTEKKPYEPDPRATLPLDTWKWELKVKLNYRRLAAQGVFDHQMVSEPYVYFPLSVTPEATTCVVAPLYSDQLVLIGALAQSLPAGWKLVVKDHLPMCGRRSASFYQQAMQFQNVVLVDPTLNSEKLVRDAQAVAVISGTSGWEAMLHGRPVLAFSDVWYLATGLGVRCRSLETIYRDLMTSLRLTADFDPAERRRRLTRIIQAVMDDSFAFDYPLMWHKRTPEELDAAMPKFEGLAAKLAERIQSTLAAAPPPHPFDVTPWTRDRTPAAAAG